MGKFIIGAVKTGYTFHLKANNGETIATSEVYENIENAKSGIASVKHNCLAANTEDQTEPDFVKQKHPKYEVYIDKAGDFRFHLKATNGQVIAASQG
ncbi:MAG: YegP family protein, partial [Hydrogenoanaerobacterium sp.]